MAFQPPHEPCVKQNPHRVWKFVHKGHYSIKRDFLKGREFDSNWLRITPDGTLTVKGDWDGYAWDGCTPKWNIMHFTIGTPDGQLIEHEKSDYKPITYYASMIHDILYQYKACAPITRKEADVLFYEMLKKHKFKWRCVYYAVVRIAGGRLGEWEHKKTSDIKIAKSK